MKTTFNVFAIALLLFNGVSACFGGWMLMTYPDGSGLGFTVDILKLSPFNSLLVPGIILFTLNGLLSLIIAWITSRQVPHYEKMVMLQGAILTGWIIVQMIMLQTINYLHVVFGAVGVLLIVLGLMVSRKGIVT